MFWLKFYKKNLPTIMCGMDDQEWKELISAFGSDGVAHGTLTQKQLGSWMQHKNTKRL